MKLINYIDRAKNELGLSSDYALAQELNVSRAAINLYRKGKPADEYFLFQIAEIIKEDPARMIAEVRAEAEKDEKRREFWIKKAAAYRGVAASLVGTFILAGAVSTAPSQTEAGEPQNAGGVNHVMYYAKLDIGRPEE